MTRPGFAHYVEPTGTGDVTWVGDEAACGDPAIVTSLDSSALPAVGAGAKFLAELGTIIDQNDTTHSTGALNGGPNNSQLHNFRWLGHNFDIWGDGGLIRGDHGRGVSVWDVSDASDPEKVAKSRGLNQGAGAENQADGTAARRI